MRAEKGVDGLEGDLKAAQTEGRVSSGIQTNVDQVFIAQLDAFAEGRRQGNESGLKERTAQLRTVSRYLHVTDGIGRAVPLRTHENGGAIHQPERQGARSVAS